MKRIGLLLGLMALLSACSVDDADGYDVQADQFIEYKYAVYDGEWTVNKQVVDTARLEVTEALRLRLPEEYLGSLCYTHLMMFSSLNGCTWFSEPKPKGQPMVVRFIVQGNSDKAEFYSLMSNSFDRYGEVLYSVGYFYVTADGWDGSTSSAKPTEYRIDLLSSEAANTIFGLDSQLWTIAIPVRGFHVVNTETSEECEFVLPNTVTIYYNATKRIR